MIAIASLAGFVLAVATLLTTQTVQAQDTEPSEIVGYSILGQDDAGPFNIQVQVSPPIPIVGISRFAVRIVDRETGEDVGDARVQIFGTPSEEGERQYSPALNSPFDPIFYLAQLDLENEGVWAIDVRVESELGEGVTVMSLQVRPRVRSGTGSGWGTALFLLVSASFAGGVAWLWYSSKKARARRIRNS